MASTVRTNATLIRSSITITRRLDSMGSGNKTTRTRNWTVVIYPEHFIRKDITPIKRIQEVLNTFHIEYVLSPLHDADKNGAEEDKKPHYHALLLFGGVKSYEQVKEVIEPLNCPPPQKVHSTKQLVRYFLHLDHPDKHQYSKNDLISYGGVDIADLLRPSSSERYALIAEMMDFIDDNEIAEITDLLFYARKDRKEDWFPILCDSSTYLINTYIKSKRHRNDVT